MRITTSLVAAAGLILCCSIALAELTVTVKPVQVVVTVTPETVTQIETLDGDKVGDAIREVGAPVVNPAAPGVAVQLKSDRDLSKSLVKIKCRTADVQFVESGVYVVTQPGTHELDVNVISEQPLQWDDQLVTVTVGDGTPPDTPHPAPDLADLTRISKDSAPSDADTTALLSNFIRQTATNVDSLCAAGNCPSFESARASYQRAIGNALGSRPRGSQADWLTWRKGLDSQLKTLNLETIEQLKYAMLAIATGLDATRAAPSN